MGKKNDKKSKKSKGSDAKVCGNCVNFEPGKGKNKGRCMRKDKKRSRKEEACGSFERR
jgi:hypothetical protein